jgi:prophage tail gpP-like protein
VYANAPRGDAASAKIARTVENGFLLTPAASARVADDAPPRPRYVESRQARTVEAAHNEAARVCAQANEGFCRGEYQVLGHRQGGRLWVPNVRVAVRDDLNGIDETMLLVAVRYEGSKAGSQVTRLTLLPEGALSELAEVEGA